MDSGPADATTRRADRSTPSRRTPESQGSVGRGRGPTRGRSCPRRTRTLVPPHTSEARTRESGGRAARGRRRGRCPPRATGGRGEKGPWPDFQGPPESNSTRGTPGTRDGTASGRGAEPGPPPPLPSLRERRMAPFPVDAAVQENGRGREDDEHEGDARHREDRVPIDGEGEDREAQIGEHRHHAELREDARIEEERVRPESGEVGGHHDHVHGG